MDGVGSVKYEWYLSQNSDINSSYTKLGTTGTVCSSTANMGHNGRYFYCKVTSTIDGVSASATSNKARLTVQTANYSTLKSGETTYYNTLEKAIAGATSGGGDTGGGTITVLNSLTDNSTANTNKTITLNTNGKTITRNTHVGTTGGTLTINGGGTIYNNDASGGDAVLGRGGNLTIHGGVRLQSEKNAISMTTGNLNIGSGYFYGKQGDAIVYGGNTYKSGTVKINTAKIYAPMKNTQGVKLQSGEYNVTITDTLMGNGSSSKVSSLETSSKVGEAVLSVSNGGTVTVTGKTRVYGGPYAGSPVGLMGPATVKFEGDSYVYATNEGDADAPHGRYCVNVHSSGTRVEFNSTGKFCSTGNYVGHTESSYKTTYIVTKGQFAAKNTKYMFYSNGEALTGYIGSPSTQNYYWMTSLTDTTSKSLSCYYYKKGV